MISRLKKLPLFLFLLPVFFCLHGSVENFGYVAASDVLKLGLIILAIITLLFLVIKFFTKSTVYAALITFYIGLWNLFFGALHDGLKSVKFLSWLSSYTVLLPLLLISTVIWIIVLRKKKNQIKLVYYLNILMLIYCAYDISLLSIKTLGRDKVVTGKHIAFDPSKVTSKPDVYYLLFDGYPGYKSLKAYFGYENKELYSFFENNRFTILPTYTNYNFTYFSLASVFNMDYVHNIPYPDSITQTDYLEQMKSIENATVFSIFKSMGYKIENLSIFDIADQEAFSNNETVVSGIQLLTHKILYRKFFKEVGWKFLSGKYEVPFFKKFFLRKDDFNRRVEEKLRENIQNNSANPDFLYAHFFLPHEPIYFDSAGNYLPQHITQSKSTVLDKNYYLGYLKYTNTKIISLVNEIIKNDPNAVVVIMSDHGYRHYTGDAISYTSDNICAVRFGKDFLNNQPGISSTVNFFRYFFNSKYDQALPYLKDTIIPLEEYSPVQ